MVNASVSVALGLGSNLGDREANLAFAREELARRGITWTAVSSLYETEPVGPVADQPPYLNQAGTGVTELAPQALLQVCLAIEAERGRIRTIRWGPRVLDIDVLLYGESILREEGLTVPHPEMARRAFVLLPLAEIAPTRIVPGTGQPIGELAEIVADKEGVRLWRSGDTKPPTRAEK
jgi:2-amino-4-hydroxy-6-hydroxymethyldihydropteridine diphosphokinase